MWRHLTNSPSVPNTSKALSPIRVIIFILVTTYSESVICTPICANGEPMGPILNGITYIVRPFMQPSKSGVKVTFISLGATQLFVGPASSLRRLHIYVRSSTRATSLGSEKQAKLLGLFSGLRRIYVPLSTRDWQSVSYSASDPSHQ